MAAKGARLPLSRVPAMKSLSRVPPMKAMKAMKVMRAMKAMHTMKAIMSRVHAMKRATKENRTRRGQKRQAEVGRTRRGEVRNQKGDDSRDQKGRGTRLRKAMEEVTQAAAAAMHLAARERAAMARAMAETKAEVATVQRTERLARDADIVLIMAQLQAASADRDSWHQRAVRAERRVDQLELEIRF